MDRILLVEDDPTDADLVIYELCNYGIANPVTIAATGDEAVRFLTTRATFVLALVDLKLPGMDGPALIEWIRNQAALNHLPIIAISGADDANSISRSFTVGANDFLLKPLTRGPFFEALRKSRLKLQITRERTS